MTAVDAAALSFDLDPFSVDHGKLVAAFAIGQGVPEEDAKRWLEQLDQADKEGRFGFVSVPVLTTATAI